MKPSIHYLYLLILVVIVTIGVVAGLKWGLGFYEGGKKPFECEYDIFLYCQGKMEWNTECGPVPDCSQIIQLPTQPELPPPVEPTTTTQPSIDACTEACQSHELRFAEGECRKAESYVPKPSGPLHVEGKKIVDSKGNQVLLRGFSLWAPNAANPSWHDDLTPEFFDKIADSGFNTVNVPVQWYQVEPDYGRVGEYDEETLARIEETLDWIGDSGLYAIVSLRILKGLWWGDDYRIEALEYTMTEEGRERYDEVLEMLVKRFDSHPAVIGFCGWFFPYHGDTGYWWDEAWEESFNSYYRPTILRVIRENSDKIIFFPPCYQGGTPDERYKNAIHARDTGQFGIIEPLPDDNVVYCHRFHRPVNVERTCTDWDYDEGFLEWQLQPGFDFMDKYDVPMMAWEWGMYIHPRGGNGPCGVRPILQSRLDCLEAKCDLMDEKGNYNWVYWTIRANSGGDNALEPNGEPTEVFNILSGHTSQPPPSEQTPPEPQPTPTPPPPITTNMILEKSISRRMSFKATYKDDEVPRELIKDVLWGAYGKSSDGRTVQNFCDNQDHPIVIYLIDGNDAYKYDPEENRLEPWKSGDFSPIIGPDRTGQAKYWLYIALDTTKCSDIGWGYAESGGVVQNIYLTANALNLGTVCQGGPGINREDTEDLLLPSNQKALLRMPLGYPSERYEDYKHLEAISRPSSPELPAIQDSNMYLEDALNTFSPSRQWSTDSLTKQELSQILWAGYGYSYYRDTEVRSGFEGDVHRTVPSAHAYYPFTLYAADSSGVYEYDPSKHTITSVTSGDRRGDIASASGNSWASDAPLIIVLVWDEDEIMTPDTAYVEVGLISQNIFLESRAWGLIADWGKVTDAAATRGALGIGRTNEKFFPTSILTIGHGEETPSTIPAGCDEDEESIGRDGCTANYVCCCSGELPPPAESCEDECRKLKYTSGECKLEAAGEGLRVIGDKIVDENGKEIRLKGFALSSNKMRYSTFSGYYTQEDFQRIKDWGFNTVRSEVYWSQIEKYKNQEGVYDDSLLDIFDKYIEMAEDVGLYWIFTTRVQYDVDRSGPTRYWCRWEDDPSGPTAAYVCTDEGLERYTEFVEWIIQEVESRGHSNIIGYSPWSIPFHGEFQLYTQQEQDDYIDIYNEKVVPRLVQTVSKHSDKLIFISAVYANQKRFEYLDPVPGYPVVYAFDFYRYQGMTHGTGPITEWDYDEQYQIDLIEPAKDFKEEHNVPVYVVEFGVRGDTEPQADCLEYKLSLFEENEMSWFYWWYSNNQGTDSFDIFYKGTSTPKPLILDALLKYSKTEYATVASPADGGCDSEETSIDRDGCNAGEVCCCSPLSKLHVEGTDIKNEDGQTVYLRGVNRPVLEWNKQGGRDPHSIAEEDFRKIKEDWNSNIVRLPFRMDWTEDAAYVEIIDDCVDWAEKYNLYIILDCHRLDTDSIARYPTDEQTFKARWLTLVNRYKNRPNVLFGILNEPHNDDGKWYPIAQRTVDAIRKTGAENLILVSSTGWSFDGTDILQVTGENVVYEFHTYYYHQSSEYDRLGIDGVLEEKGWTNVGKNHPVLVGEIGGANPIIDGDRKPDPEDLAWFDEMLTEIENRGWHYTAWAWFYGMGNTGRFDLLEEDWKTPTESGEILLKHLGKSGGPGGPLRVSGKKIIDSNGEEFVIKALHFRQSELTNTWRDFVNQDLFDDIAGWGFNTVKFLFAMDSIQPTKYGDFDPEVVERINEFLKMAEKSGLNVVLSVNLAQGKFGAWEGTEDEMDHAEMTDWLADPDSDALQIWEKFMTRAIERWDSYTAVIGYCGWEFPFHGGAGKPWSNPDWEDSFYDVWTPKIHEVIRGHSDKIIFYAPCYQGGVGNELQVPNYIYDRDDIYHSGQDTSAFRDDVERFGPMLTDGNVIFAHRFHRPRWVERNNYVPESSDDDTGDPPYLEYRRQHDWDYPREDRVEYLMWSLGPALEFRDDYKKPITVWEWQLDRDSRATITQARFDNYLRTKLEVLEDLDYSWFHKAVRTSTKPYTDPLFDGRSTKYSYNSNDFSPSATLEVLKEFV